MVRSHANGFPLNVWTCECGACTATQSSKKLESRLWRKEYLKQKKEDLDTEAGTWCAQDIRPDLLAVSGRKPSASHRWADSRRDPFRETGDVSPPAMDSFGRTGVPNVWSWFRACCTSGEKIDVPAALSAMMRLRKQWQVRMTLKASDTPKRQSAGKLNKTMNYGFRTTTSRSPH